jgi:acyl carrier protein
MPPVKGVLHGAMVLKDALLETTTLDNWQSVIGPKVDGAMNLHCVLGGSPLDFFICLSSVVGTLGNPGQSSYAGSNSFLDAFCEWRRSQGLPACAIALPRISDVGYVAELAEMESPLVIKSDLYNLAITGGQVGELLGSLLSSRDLGVNVVAGVSRTKEMAANSLLKDPLLSKVRHLLSQHFSQGGNGVENTKAGSANEPLVDRDLLSRAQDAETASKMVFNAVARKISKDMMIPMEDIAADSMLSQIGLDSLVAVEFRNWLAKELSTDIRVLDIISCKTIHDLVGQVMKRSSLLTQLD